MVLLIVDTQELIMTEEQYNFSAFVNNVEQLIAAARLNGTEVIYVQHDDGVELTQGVEGYDIFSRFAPRSEERRFVKHFNSAFCKTGLLEYLKEKKQTQIMIAGLQTDYCIDATIKCGFEHGFEMFVPAGCNTTVDNEYMTGEKSYEYYNKKIWNGRYANRISLEEAMGNKSWKGEK